MSLARQTLRVACAVWLALLSARGAHAQAEPATNAIGGVEATLLGGYDSNPQLAINPNARRLSSGEAVEGPGSSGASALTLDAFGGWASHAWVGAGLNTDVRAYHSGDARHDTALRLLGGLPLGKHELSLQAQAGRYDASFGVDDAWYASLETRLRLLLSAAWSLGVEPRVGLRDYTQGTQTNFDVGGRVDLQLRDATWFAVLGADADRRTSTDDTARRTQLVPFALFAWRLPDWELSMRIAMFARWFDAGPQDGVEHTGELLGRVRLVNGLWLTSQVGFGVARGQENALSYERVTALLGLSATWQSGGITATPVLDRAVQGPARVDDSGTHFEVCRAGAQSVSVVGTFNDWSAERGQLTRAGNGCFRGRLSVPAGRHRYQWLIDGAIVRPANAPAYAPDGFGGEDAVLVVPE